LVLESIATTQFQVKATEYLFGMAPQGSVVALAKELKQEKPSGALMFAPLDGPLERVLKKLQSTPAYLPILAHPNDV
jgi:hypothetical protein